MALADTYRVEVAKWDAIAAGRRGRMNVFAPQEDFQTYARKQSQLRGVAESIDEDPERLGEIRARRQLLHELRRKYGATLADVCSAFVQHAAPAQRDFTVLRRWVGEKWIATLRYSYLEREKSS